MGGRMDEDEVPGVRDVMKKCTKLQTNKKDEVVAAQSTREQVVQCRYTSIALLFYVFLLCRGEEKNDADKRKVTPLVNPLTPMPKKTLKKRRLG